MATQRTRRGGVGPEDSDKVIWHEHFGEAPNAVEGQRREY